MNKEIKEILELIIDEKRSDRFGRIMLEITKGELLLDYITNLQTIEQEYSAILSENAELDNKITNLQKENESLKRQNEYLRNDEYLKQVKWERELNENLVKDLQEENERLLKEIQNVSLLQKAKDKLQNDYQEAVDKINELRIQLSATEKVSAEYIKINDKAIDYINRLKNFKIKYVLVEEKELYASEKDFVKDLLNILKGSDKE